MPANSRWDLIRRLRVKMEQTGCSETSAYKIQTPGNYPEESTKLPFICLQSYLRLVSVGFSHHQENNFYTTPEITLELNKGWFNKLSYCTEIVFY